MAHRNNMLAEIKAIFTRSWITETNLTGPEDVECDVCIWQKRKAVKSCLVYLASYCATHFNLHNELNPGIDHNVIEENQLKNTICAYHKKPKWFYSCNEQQCVCALCALNKHGSHKLVPTNLERQRQQVQVGLTKEKISQRICQTEDALRELQQAVQTFTRSTQTAILYTESIFTHMTQSSQTRKSAVQNQIKTMENSQLQYAEEIQKQLQMEIVTLKKRTTDLDQLCSSKDDIYFLQTIPHLSTLPMYEPLPKITFSTHAFENINQSIYTLCTKINALCTAEVERVTEMVASMKVIDIPVPLSRGDFLKYFHQPAVEHNSVSPNLILKKNCKLIWSEELQKYPRNPERFGYLAQALCKKGLSERSYWEVEWHGPQVYVGVSYKEVLRRGCGSCIGFGHNNQSWSLCCSHSRSYFCHDAKETDVLGPVSSRIGVYLDYRAGTLSFYSVSDMMILLHSVTAKFNEPLYPGFWVFDGSNVRIRQYEENMPSETDKNEDAKSVICSRISQFDLCHY